MYVHHKHYHCGVITNIFAIAGFQECCCCMHWSKELAHCQTMAAEDRLLNTNFWVVLAFYLKFLDCIIFCIFSHAHSTLCIISQAQRRCPVFWRRRFLEPKLVLIWRRPAVCCPSVTVSLVCTGWGTFRPKRWWNSPPVWRWAFKESRCFKMINILLDAHITQVLALISADSILL